MDTKPKSNEQKAVFHSIGELVCQISSGQHCCLRKLLTQILPKTSAAISCAFAVYKTLTTGNQLTDGSTNGFWYGVDEYSLEGIEENGYSKQPITEYLARLNENSTSKYECPEKQLLKKQPFVGPVIINTDTNQKANLIIQPLTSSIFNEKLNGICCAIFLNSKKMWGRRNEYTSEEAINPLVSPIEVWLWWLHYQRSRLQELCHELSCGKRRDDTPIKNIFQSSVRLLPLSDIISYANAGMLAYHGSDDDKIEKQDQWLKDEVIRFIVPADPKQENCWHNCLEDPWPPCHKGAKADRELATKLLYFCPWSSGARRECKKVPESLTGSWHETIRKQLWGWMTYLNDHGAKELDLQGIENPSKYKESSGVDPCFLNKKALMHLFVAEYLGANVHTMYFDPNIKSLGNEERGRSLGHIGRVLQHVQAKVPLDWRTIESLVWMISEYCHNHLNIDPRLDIASHLLHAARTEPALHAMKTYYRDHFFHAIEVCFTGHLLLLTRDKSGKCLWEYVAEQLQQLQTANGLSKRYELEDILQQWYVASLLHDVGYSIQIFSSLQKMLDFYKHPKEMKDFRNHLKESLEMLSSSILNNSKLAQLLNLSESDKEIGSDHGVIAAVHLEYLISKLDSSKCIGNYQPAIRAIGMHNNRHAVVDFTTDPIGFLLVLCDTIQEWNRPHLRGTTAPSMMLAWLMSANENLYTTGSLDMVSLNVIRSGEPKPRPDFKIISDTQGNESDTTLKIGLTYTDQIQVDSGVFNLWIDSSCNLQRLCFGKFPFNIELTFYTPYFQFPGKAKLSQMHRLRDAAVETHMHFLHDWLPRTPEGTNTTNAVRYTQRVSEDSCYDILTLDLKKLAETKTILGDSSAFHNCLRNWKHWSEDRDFEGDYTPRIPGE